MVECDKCKEWFHSYCENISKVLDAIVISGIDCFCYSCNNKLICHVTIHFSLM